MCVCVFVNMSMSNTQTGMFAYVCFWFRVCVCCDAGECACVFLARPIYVSVVRLWVCASVHARVCVCVVMVEWGS